jgi:hypothetical protein
MRELTVTPTIYRIVTETGDVHNVTVYNGGAGYLSLASPGRQSDVFSDKNDATACVAWYAGMRNWPVAEIVPPGGETRAELVARVRRETLAEAKTAVRSLVGGNSWEGDTIDRIFRLLSEAQS